MTGSLPKNLKNSPLSPAIPLMECNKDTASPLRAPLALTNVCKLMRTRACGAGDSTGGGLAGFRLGALTSVYQSSKFSIKWMS